MSHTPTEIGDFESIRRRLATVQSYLDNVGSASSARVTEISAIDVPSKPETTAQHTNADHPAQTSPVVSDGSSVALVAGPAVSEIDAYRRRIAHLVPITPVTSSPSPEPERASWPAAPAQEALLGLAGDIVRVLEPHTESDPVAILLQSLVAYGNVVGCSAYFQVEGDRHHTNLSAVLVGPTSKARKGTSWGQVRRLMAAAAEPITVECTWHVNSLKSGLSSGEGLIWAVRDATGTDDSDPGVLDKRLLVVESEFARPLVAMGRDGNVLSEVLREAWDSGNLQILIKNNPVKATGAHISIIGHVTCDDLRRNLSSTEQANGFANRFLWLCVQRSKVLPEGGSLTEEAITQLADRLRQAIRFGSRVREMKRDDEARELWRQVYPSLSQGRAGLLGSVTSRAEAQALRLSMIYALLDSSEIIRVEHLRAALALWRYCEASARYIFGEALGDPVADAILAALRNRRPQGLTRTEIRDLFGRHGKEDKIAAALGSLEAMGLAKMQSQESGGRPSQAWFATNLVAT